MVKGMYSDFVKEHKIMLAAMIAIVVAIIIIIIAVIIVYWVNMSNDDGTADADDTDADSQSFVGHNGDGYEPLIQLYKNNKKLKADLKRLGKYDVQHVVSVYSTFKARCKSGYGKTCPKKIIKIVDDILYFIYVNTGQFGETTTIPYRKLIQYIIDMDRTLFDLLDTLEVLGNTEIPNDLKGLREQAMESEEDVYQSIVETNCIGQKTLSKQIVEDMKYDNYVFNNSESLKDSNWLEINTPKEGLTAYDLKVQQGRMNEFNGCFEDLTRDVDRQLINESHVDEERRNVDTRYPNYGAMGSEFNEPTVSDYRGRHDTYTYS